MHRFRSRRAVAAVALTSAIALLAACQTPPPYGGPPTANFRFEATQVTVVHNQDETCVIICVNKEDEVYMLNLWFRVTVGQPGSAQAGYVKGSPDAENLADGDTHNFTGAQRATVNFSNVAVPDVLDLAQGAKVEVVGVWSWAVESDFTGVTAAAGAAADAIKSALNSTLATGSLPSDAGQIVSTILSGLGLGGVFGIIGPALGSLVWPLQDDVVGSRMYVGVGASGTLQGIIDSSAAGASFPTLDIPVTKVPPDIQGGSIFATGNRSFTNQVMDQGNVDGDYRNAFTFTQV